MLKSMHRFFLDSCNTLPNSSPLSENTLPGVDFLKVNLDREIASNLATTLIDTMDTQSFSNWVSKFPFDNSDVISEISKLNILFAVILSGNVEKLQALRRLPKYDQMPLNLQDKATGITTLSISGSSAMNLYVHGIIRQQRLETEGGAKRLAENRYHQYASGISIIPSLKDDCKARKDAEKAMIRDETMHVELSRILKL